MRKSRTWGIGALLAALFVLALGQAASRGMLNLATAVGVMGVVLALVGGALAHVISWLSTAEVSRFGAITVEPAAIIVERAEGGPRWFPRRHIVNGWLEPSGAVHIVFRDRTELVLFPAADDSRAGGRSCSTRSVSPRGSALRGSRSAGWRTSPGQQGSSSGPRRRRRSLRRCSRSR